MTDQAKFFVPGPTWVRPDILREMVRPMIGHRSREFEELFRRITPRLRRLFATSQSAFFAAASGTGLMEGALVNTVPRSVLVTTCGAFSERWLTIAHKLGLEADQLEFEWGQPVDPVRLADHLQGRHRHYDAVTITHNETSTGVINDVPALAAAIRSVSKDTLILVDSVSALGCAPLLFDEWGLDVCFASVQKGIALPPGLTLFAVSDRALEQADRKQYKGLYFNFLEFKRNADADGVPFTPALPLVYALDRQLERIVDEEGLEERWKRHRMMRDRTLERTAAYAEPASERSALSPSVTALMPARITAAELLAAMRAEGFVLGSGYGKWKDSTFRIGHMGDVTAADLDAMLGVLERIAGVG
ncbi:MAG TPA: alanine--glyoxylate aminotransferase family protein [Thermoanaerobaculia bacterium]|nr:alanine--glyoxylate aminotransferase family protein [Thermoanaerobaculia bacterium]